MLFFLDNAGTYDFDLIPIGFPSLAMLGSYKRLLTFPLDFFCSSTYLPTLPGPEN